VRAGRTIALYERRKTVAQEKPRFGIIGIGGARSRTAHAAGKTYLSDQGGVVILACADMSEESNRCTIYGDRGILTARSGEMWILRVGWCSQPVQGKFADYQGSMMRKLADEHVHQGGRK
jgi:hypothetical protein